MKPKLLFSFLFIAFLGIANISLAQDGNFSNKHPRRAELNHRMHHMDRHIHHKMKKGDITRNQARHMHHRNHRMRGEERRLAYRHRGHFSRHEQYRHNRYENRMNRRIRKV